MSVAELADLDNEHASSSKLADSDFGLRFFFGLRIPFTLRSTATKDGAFGFLNSDFR
jgi:hypothetical protein